MTDRIIENLNIQIFADGADIASMRAMNDNPLIKGLTTNPTLMRKSGITDYQLFAKEVLSFVKERPISFEVFTDDFQEMKWQALEIASWADNVYVKIPITNTRRESAQELLSELSNQGVKINVTAILTTSQVHHAIEALNPSVASYLSVFAGRIADTGRDPIGYIEDALRIMKSNQKSKLIWASPREILNVIQADSIGCHIITATTEILNKLELLGKSLEDYSQETVEMFHRDAEIAGYKLTSDSESKF